MIKKQILYGHLLYELNSEKENSVSLIESSGLFNRSAKYVAFVPSTTDTVLSIPEVIEDDNGVKYSVTEISKTVFDNNDTLQEVRIPRSITRIEWSFRDCINLKAIKVDPKNPFYCDLEGVLYTNHCATLVAYPNKQFIL